MENLDLLFDYLINLAPWVQYALSILGTLVVVGSTIVKLTPTKKDDAYMNKIMKIPILGIVLETITRFSPLNHKKIK